VSAVWVLAGQVVREASRRRLLVALVVVTFLAIALNAWGIGRLMNYTRHGGGLGPRGNLLAETQLLGLVMFVFSAVLVMAAVFAAAASLATELESGIALAVLARPVRRSELLLGKWLGLSGLVAAYVAVTCALEFWLVGALAHLAVPHPLAAFAYLTVEGITVMTLALLLSTRMAAMTAGMIATAAFFLMWMGGVVGDLGLALGNVSLVNVGTLSHLILPTDGLWRGVLYSIESPLVQALAQGDPTLAANPLLSMAPPTAAYQVWCAVWILAALGGAVMSLSRRPL
jgi:ABC-type transport system involved in multi-copper enzyme maturation permease subunit